MSWSINANMLCEKASNLQAKMKEKRIYCLVYRLKEGLINDKRCL